MPFLFGPEVKDLPLPLCLLALSLLFAQESADALVPIGEGHQSLSPTLL